MTRRRSSLWDDKSLKDHLSGIRYYEGEHHLSREDEVRCSDALFLWMIALREIALSYRLERSFSVANLIRWSGRPELDVQALNQECKDVLACLRDYDPAMGAQGFRAYKAWIRERLEGLSIFGLLRPLIYLLYGGDWRVFRDLNTILQFWTRLTLQDVDWILSQNAEEYISAEDEMDGWTYPTDLTKPISAIIGTWLTDFDFETVKPTFSNGATAETKRGAGVTQKVRKGSMTDSLQAADCWLQWGNPYHFRFGSEHHSSVNFVPKGIDKKRTVCPEPAVNQYYQKGMAIALDMHFRRHPEMHISLQDQGRSQRMCLAGSKSTQYSTVDLSSASDTVTWRLVKDLFCRGYGACSILCYMNLVRTEYADLNNVEVKLAKFAPMGSSLCFPIECIVFAGIAAYACDLVGIPRNFRVYGDDIIIDSRAMDTILALLDNLHFTVNRDKSFGPYSHFLEACGMEAYYGHDVSPCRLPRRYDVVKLSDGLSPEQLTGAIELSNRLYAFGLFKTRRELVRRITSVYPNVPFSVDPERGIYHPDPSNQHLWCISPHNCRYSDVEPWDCLRLYFVKQTRNRVEPGDALIDYTRTLEAMESRAVDPWGLYLPQDVRTGPTRSSLSNEWVPSWNFD